MKDLPLSLLGGAGFSDEDIAQVWLDDMSRGRKGAVRVRARKPDLDEIDNRRTEPEFVYNPKLPRKTT